MKTLVTLIAAGLLGTSPMLAREATSNTTAASAKTRSVNAVRTVSTLEVNDPNGMTLTEDVFVTDTLKLTLGHIYTSGGTLTLGSDAVIVGGDKNSYVFGCLRHVYNSRSMQEHFYPVGN